MTDNLTGNAARLVGEIFLPGASHYVSGNISSGLAHSLLAAATGAALIGSGAAPVVGALAVIGIKLNSFASATTGRGIASHVGDLANETEAKLRAATTRSSAPVVAQ
jgi:hypothetical protein